MIDPATGIPAVTEVVRATALTPTCAEAEVAATHALFLGTSVTRTIAGITVTGDDVIVSVPIEDAA